MADPGPGARQLAELFHDRYERLAPEFGYVTREETRTFDPTSTNGRLMIAVCDEILNWFDRNDVGLCARCAAELHAHETTAGHRLGIANEAWAENCSHPTSRQLTDNSGRWCTRCGISLRTGEAE